MGIVSKEVDESRLLVCSYHDTFLKVAFPRSLSEQMDTGSIWIPMQRLYIWNCMTALQGKPWKN
uniref:Uncharacterized protein n=1 Tax=Solanum lycopersicum TaxID=4081 RepID=A0A3Q7FM00_SOLLC